MRTIGHARQPLDRLFSNSSHIAILHALQNNRQGLSGRAIARQAGLNHQVGAVALRNLEALGVVERHGGGKTQLIHLNFDSRLVKDLILPLLRGETLLLTDALRDIVRHFSDKAMTITLFGSMARREDVLGSDMDILFVVHGKNKNEILEEAGPYSAGFIKKFGIRLSPIAWTATEVRDRYRAKNRLVLAILSDGHDLLPKKLREVLE
jgi:predicted nucleotidyltransferase